MENCIERKTLFLYPNLSKLDGQKRKRMIKLITDISRIVTTANSELMSLMRMGFNSTCLPKVEIVETNEIADKEIDFERVRICINKYRDYDYREYYQRVIENYKSSKSDISHLVGVNIINDPSGRPKFICDSEQNFDIIIELGLDSLYDILIAIMTDISLYHYFNLSANLDDRKKFSCLKCQYLLKDSESTFYETYGTKPQDLEGARYLPFSLRGMGFLRAKSTEEKRDYLEKVVKQYFDMLIDVMPTKINVNCECAIIDEYELNLSSSHSSYFDTFLNNENYFKYNKGSKMIIILPNKADSTGLLNNSGNESKSP